mmetsp:Transcript_5519/g.21191  ORF Transcript_5519/g.21191 Transcript_5519/m.21191 type:complete len:240 (-) Transcript_5519:89-808(-)
MLPSTRAEPMESISSMKMMDGAWSLAITKSSLTMREPSPMYFCTSSEPDTRMNVQSVWCATALASSVFPVPGGPYSSTPLGCAIPRLSNSSGCLMGSSTTSLISLICLSNPPTISYVESGTFSTRMRLTSGSTLFGRILWRAYESWRSATRQLGVTSFMSISLSISTTYLPSGFTFTSTLVLPMTFTTSPTWELGSWSFINSSRRSRTFVFHSLRCAARRRRFCAFSLHTTSSSAILDS